MVIVIHSFPTWLPQTQTWMYHQVRYLPETIENHVLCETTENLEQFWLPNIHSLSEAPRCRYYTDKILRKLAVRRHFGFDVQIQKNCNADILHSHFGNIGWRNIPAVQRAQTKHMVTFYGWDVNHLPRIDPKWYNRYGALFENVECVLCEGRHMAGCVVKLGCPEEKVTVHHLGVPVDDIAYRPRKWDGDEPFRVLIAASFREKKGIPCAFEALGEIQHHVPLEVTVVGDANNELRSQREKRKILAVIEKYHLQSKVRLRGYQPYSILMKEAYRHHVFLSPSITADDGDTEGGAPVTLIEMAASGMPIVSTKHCDIPEVIKDGVSGLLVEERDTGGLVRQLLWLIRNPDCWKDMLDAGRKHIESEYDVHKQCLKLSRMYQNISDSKPPGSTISG